MFRFRSIVCLAAIVLVSILPAHVALGDVVINMPPPPVPQAAPATPNQDTVPKATGAAGDIALARYGRARSRPSNVSYARTSRTHGYYGGYPYYYRSPYSTYAPFGHSYCNTPFGYGSFGLFTYRVVGSSN